MNPLAKEPAAENTKIYENNVPDINPCAKTFSRIKNKVSRFLKIERERSIGRLASPSLKKGSGLGMAYSIADRNIHKAAKKDISFVRLESIFMQKIVA